MKTMQPCNNFSQSSKNPKREEFIDFFWAEIYNVMFVEDETIFLTVEKRAHVGMLSPIIKVEAVFGQSFKESPAAQAEPEPEPEPELESPAKEMEDMSIKDKEVEAKARAELERRKNRALARARSGPMPIPPP